jgi:hypothetical protein
MVICVYNVLRMIFNVRGIKISLIILESVLYVVMVKIKIGTCL